jgi:hypothetical protein
VLLVEGDSHIIGAAERAREVTEGSFRVTLVTVAKAGAGYL